MMVLALALARKYETLALSLTLLSVAWNATRSLPSGPFSLWEAWLSWRMEGSGHWHPTPSQ